MSDADWNGIKSNMYYIRAAEYFDDEEYDEAISTCSTAISQGIYDARIYNIRAHSYMAQDEYLKARLDYDASLELDPDDSWVRSTRDMLESKGY
jgi:tetratricopeptide (TPR) repeat protein